MISLSECGRRPIRTSGDYVWRCAGALGCSGRNCVVAIIYSSIERCDVRPHTLRARIVHMQWLAMVPAVSKSYVRDQREAQTRSGTPSLPAAAGCSSCAWRCCRRWAKTHPVPLDKNIDSAKCLECHEERAKGKAVHSAIATGCLSCHEVRVNKDVTRIKLITTTPQALCLTCHAEKMRPSSRARCILPRCAIA